MRKATKLWYPVSLTWLNLVDPFPPSLVTTKYGFRAACFVAWIRKPSYKSEHLHEHTCAHLSNLYTIPHIKDIFFQTFIQHHPKLYKTQGSSWSREVVGGFLEQQKQHKIWFRCRHRAEFTHLNCLVMGSCSLFLFTVWFASCWQWHEVNFSAPNRSKLGFLCHYKNSTRRKRTNT